MPSFSLTKQEQELLKQMRSKKPRSFAQDIRKSQVFKDTQRFSQSANLSPMTKEQWVMSDIMGGGTGGRVWGVNNEPVKLNGALNDNGGTARMFGF